MNARVENALTAKIQLSSDLGPGFAEKLEISKLPFLIIIYLRISIIFYICQNSEVVFTILT